MRQCFLCGRTDCIEKHHVFHGTANRKISEKYGFTVDLCHWCHNEPPNGVHFNRERDLFLKRKFQSEFEKTHSRAEFVKLIGRNYL